jgi:hypothetical protein
MSGRASLTFPNESEAYRAARDRLLAQEVELRRRMEEVAAVRRALPPGGEVPQDYIFQGMRPDGTRGDVRLSELFAPGRDSLVVYNMMFPRHPADYCLEAQDVRGLELIGRRRMLQKALKRAGPVLRFSEHLSAEHGLRRDAERLGREVLE